MVKQLPTIAARLASRRFVLLGGRDSEPLLNGISTNTVITGIGRGKAASAGWSTAFLGANGRVLLDGFVYPLLHSAAWRAWVRKSFPGIPCSRTDFTCLIETEATELESLVDQLERYRLRNQVMIHTVPEDSISAWYVWAYSGLSPSSPDAIPASYDHFSQLEMKPGKVSPKASLERAGLFISEPRLPGLGLRFVLPGTVHRRRAEVMLEHALKSIVSGPEGGLSIVDENAYRAFRHSYAIPEGTADLRPRMALPHQANLDLLRTLSFTKGCYLGQELTVRTQHQGVIRKRLLPTVLYPPGTKPPTEIPAPDPRITVDETEPSWPCPPRSTSIRPVGSRTGLIGKWATGPATNSNVGLSLVNVEAATPLQVGWPERELGPFNPDNQFEMSWKTDETEHKAGAAVMTPAWIAESLKSRIKALDRQAEETAGKRAEMEREMAASKNEAKDEWL